MPAVSGGVEGAKWGVGYFVRRGKICAEAEWTIPWEEEEKKNGQVWRSLGETCLRLDGQNREYHGVPWTR